MNPTLGSVDAIRNPATFLQVPTPFCSKGRFQQSYEFCELREHEKSQSQLKILNRVGNYKSTPPSVGRTCVKLVCRLETRSFSTHAEADPGGVKNIPPICLFPFVLQDRAPPMRVVFLLAQFLKLGTAPRVPPPAHTPRSNPWIRPCRP